MKPYQIEAIKRNYPAGTRVELEYMEDSQAVPPGTKGTVRVVDDVGTIHVEWDNGSALGICPDLDRFKRVSDDRQRDKGTDNNRSVDSPSRRDDSR